MTADRFFHYTNVRKFGTISNTAAAATRLEGRIVRAAQASLTGSYATAEGQADNKPNWFYPAWAATARFNEAITVRDTESALGRYSQQTKEIGLKDLARMHGHLCDGLVTGFELR
jgi:hypothetical protein